MVIRSIKTADDSYLKICFVNLPDIHSPDEMAVWGYSAYGRLAIVADSKTLWIGLNYSRFPRTTQYGWYWAVEKETGDVLIGRRTIEDDIWMLLEEFDALLPELTNFLEVKGLITYHSAEESS